MINEVYGDILTSDKEAIVNTVNCVGVMGAGVALAVKKKYPGCFEEYYSECLSGRVRIGEMHVYRVPSVIGILYIINFPTKNHWSNPSELSYIDKGLHALVRVLEDYNIGSVAIPKLGCGHGGLLWDDVRPMIETHMSSVKSVDISIYIS